MTENIILPENVKYIQLTKGQYALVDAADFEWLNQYKWYARKAKHTFYAQKKQNYKIIIMSRFILGAPPGMQVDHIDGDGLNNTRANLRLSTPGQNQYNQSPCRGGSSKHKGVSWHKRDEIWQAYINIGGKRIYLGRFTSETEAALAYNAAAPKYHGEYARLNVIPSL